jgi:hypothetical protein
MAGGWTVVIVSIGFAIFLCNFERADGTQVRLFFKFYIFVYLWF